MTRLLPVAVMLMLVQGLTPDEPGSANSARRMLRQESLPTEETDREKGEALSSSDETDLKDEEGYTVSAADKAFLEEDEAPVLGGLQPGRAQITSDGNMNFDEVGEEDISEGSELTPAEFEAGGATVYAENVCPWWWNPPITTFNTTARRCYNGIFCTTASCCTAGGGTYLCPSSAPYMCASMDNCLTPGQNLNCDYTCVATSRLCSAHGGLRACEGPPGPRGPLGQPGAIGNTGSAGDNSTATDGINGTDGTAGARGKDAESSGIGGSVATLLIACFLLNIGVAGGVFAYFAKTYQWKRQGFHDPKSKDVYQEHVDDEFQTHEVYG